MGTPHVIETRYKGLRFRSRIEARWAVFFDAMGLKYAYEPEGYVIDGVPYLPDFILPDEKSLIEIKGAEPTQEQRDLVANAATDLHLHGYIFWGGAWHCCTPDSGIVDALGMPWWYSGFIECPVCGDFVISPSAQVIMMPCSCLEPFGPSTEVDAYGDNVPGPILDCPPTDRLRQAIKRAREARFEHGETPSCLPIPFVSCGPVRERPGGKTD